MARGKRLSAEQIIAKLRQVEVQLDQGKSVALLARMPAFASKVVIGAWKNYYN